jgi:hypothetical protein
MKMNKEARKVNGKWQFLLGMKDGESYWLEQSNFDCDWYWAIGYVESYRGYGQSDRSWRSHQHFDTLFLNGHDCAFDLFNDFFEETPFTDKETWKVLELMKAAYTARRYSDMLHRGNAGITENPAKDLIKNDVEYCRLNNTVIPTIMNELYKILLPKTEDGTIYEAYPLNDILHDLDKEAIKEGNKND